MEDQVITLSLTVKEVNTILATLAKHPFEEVFTLISKVRDQGESQIEEQKDAKTAEPEAREGELVL